MNMDSNFRGFLDRVLSAPLKPEPVDTSVLERKQEPREPEGDGAENSCLDGLCLKDLVCEYTPKYLKDHLPVFADADQIIKMEKTFKEKPELRYAERAECSGSCDGCKTDSGCSGKESEEQED